MQQDTIRLSVPAEPAYARAVRMMAANLAVVADMGVDDVEDLRMAAEEGFVYSCATEPSTSDVSFSVGTGSIHARLRRPSALGGLRRLRGRSRRPCASPDQAGGRCR